MKSKTLLTALVIVAFMFVSCSDVNDDMNNTTIIREGVGLGSVIAVVASWSRNQSILWAILHGIFGWFYVIYYAITREQKSNL
jgi:protein-S-isoprenylcysteine O-methyltransferase Ste14